MQSTRSSSRGRTESGFALIAAVVLSMLYIGLMELMLIDSTRSLQEADRFRSHVIASTLAENGAELAAEQMLNTLRRTARGGTPQGSMSGDLKRQAGGHFTIDATGTDGGVLRTTATVKLEGHWWGQRVSIDWSRHSD